jgi:sucrose-6-phosphate hydrolase SacC (GH32 family)
MGTRLAAVIWMTWWAATSHAAESRPEAAAEPGRPGSLAAAEGPAGTRLHYIHPRHPVGDVHPYYEDGTYYLIYVFDPGTWRVGQLQSTDLLHWEERAISHTPAPVIPQVLPHYFVLQIIPDALQGGYRTFYPYHGMRTSCSRDLVNWQTADPQLAVPAQGGYSRMADPFPFWNADRQEYWMVVTLRREGLPLERAGAFGYATSPDLARWTWRGELYTPHDMAEPEVPSLFPMGGHWYLLAFPNDGRTLGQPTYRLSRDSSGPWTVPVPDRLDGKHFCAGRTADDGRRRLLFGWIPLRIQPSGAQHWGGHLALPRELYSLPDGRLAVRLEPSVAQRIRGEVWFPRGRARLQPAAGDWQLTPAQAAARHAGQRGVLRLEPAPGRIDLEVELTLGADCERAGLVLGRLPHAAGYEVVVERSARRLAVTNRDGTVRVQQATAELPARQHRLRVVVEEDIVEAFLDDRYALAARMPETLDGASVELVACGAAGFENISLYRLRALQEIDTPAGKSGSGD